MSQQDFPDFDTLMEMAKNQPEKLENIFRDEVNSVIESASEEHHHRLRGLQFQADAQRILAKNPMDACIRISQMMHRSLGDLHTTLNDFSLQHDHSNQVLNDLSDKQQDVSDILYFEGRKQPKAT
ncbi:DUF3135 domain-containing protein [Shewanella woodyi]|uniref:DUF3135 domain-containing protein n=1 Tax=Shewanella woodyi TaxID=60961 RepID=UPI003748B14C